MRRFVVGLAMGIATFAPSWAFADDEQIAKTIVEKLEAQKKQGQLKGFNIDLKVDKGTVWMTGHVASVEQQKAALDIARKADGVEAVVNDLKIKRNPSSAKADESKKVAASSEVAERPSLLGRWFGSTSSKSDKGATAAKSPKADSKVQPAGHEKPIAIAPAATAKNSPSNEALIEVLAGRLNRQKEAGSLKDFDINLTADQGSVTVSGDVASVEQRDMILGTIRRTPGVTQVVNMLRLPQQETAQEAAPAPAPAEAQAAVEPAMPVAEPTPAPLPRPMARPSRAPAREVVPAHEFQGAATGTGVAPAAAPAAEPVAAPIPAPVPEPVPMPAPRPTARSVGGYTAIPVQMVPSALPAGQASPMPANMQRPLAFASTGGGPVPASGMQPIPQMPTHLPGPGMGVAPARFDHPNLPAHAWPSYAAYPNYAGVTYPKQYSPAAWPYIGPFYPYPQVPLGWRKVMLQWDDGWWYLDFKDK